MRDDGRIFAVTVESQTHYRAFQFEHGQPKVVFSTLVSAGGKHRSGWGMVVWRDAPNRWLDGCILVEFINTVPGRVVDALSNDITQIG